MKGEKVLAGKLDHWYKQDIGDGFCVIWGRLDQDMRGRFDDGTFIHTSRTPNIPMKEGDVVETHYSKYTLGVPEGEL